MSNETTTPTTTPEFKPDPEFSPEEVLAQYLIESNRFNDAMGHLTECIAAAAVAQFPDVKTLTQRQLDVDGDWFDTDLWDDIEYTAAQLIWATMRNVHSEKFVAKVRIECSSLQLPTVREQP